MCAVVTIKVLQLFYVAISVLNLHLRRAFIVSHNFEYDVFSIIPKKLPWELQVNTWPTCTGG